VTSRLLPITGSPNASEALLLIDEPGAALTGAGPATPQIACGNPNVGAGPGGCVEYLGVSTVSAGNSGFPVATNPSGTTPTCTVGTPCTPGANVLQGITSGNQVTFFGIPVLPPASAGLNRVHRITNIRAP